MEKAKKKIYMKPACHSARRKTSRNNDPGRKLSPCLSARVGPDYLVNLLERSRSLGRQRVERKVDRESSEIRFE